MLLIIYRPAPFLCGAAGFQIKYVFIPDKLDEMFEIARILSRGIPYVRVDLYYENDQVYFGEMTFYSDAGFDAGMLAATDRLFGEKIDLPYPVKRRV